MSISIPPAGAALMASRLIGIPSSEDEMRDEEFRSQITAAAGQG